MTASLIFVIAASYMISRATRIRSMPGMGLVPDNIIGRVTSPGPMIHTPFFPPALQMQMGRFPDDGSAWSDNISDTATTTISVQKFPPTAIWGMDTRRLLQKWCARTPRLEDDKRAVLKGMRVSISEANGMFSSSVNKRMYGLDRVRLTDMLPGNKKLEMVGLVSKGVEFPFLESGSSAVDASVLALSLIAREIVRDDGRGSLVKKIREASYVKVETRFWWGRSKKKIKAFAILGLADAPVVPEQIGRLRVLLSKIKRYADEEAAIVAVPTWAYYSRDGKDLSEYYVRLGFEKVEMEGRLPELIYTGTSCSGPDTSVEDEQIMIGMNIWTGV